MRYSDKDVVSELQSRIDASSVRKVAKEFGVTPAFISNVSRGNVPPGPKVAAVLGYVEDGLRWVKQSDVKSKRRGGK